MLQYKQSHLWKLVLDNLRNHRADLQAKDDVALAPVIAELDKQLAAMTANYQQLMTALSPSIETDTSKCKNVAYSIYQGTVKLRLDQIVKHILCGSLDYLKEIDFDFSVAYNRQVKYGNTCYL